MIDLKNYSLRRYLFFRGVLPELEGLDTADSMLQLDRKKELLGRLGIKKIGRTFVDDCLDSAITDRVKRLRSGVGSYLERYCGRFNQDAADGKIERCVSGEQLELEFFGMLGKGLMEGERDYVDKKALFALNR